MVDGISLAGQTAVITGGGRGIGRHIAQALAAAGATVVVAGRKVEYLEDTVDMIAAQKAGKGAYFVLDVTDAEQVTDVMAQITEQFSTIDLLVNNAGIVHDGGMMWETDPAAWWKVMDVNVRGAFLCARAVLPGMIERNTGRIINMGSYAMLGASPSASSYSISKAALSSLTTNIAAEADIVGAKIAAFTISPGLVLTDMTRGAPPFKDLPPSAWADVELSANLCVQLASGKADALTGRFIHVQDDDLDDLIARADRIKEENLQVMTLKRG